MTIKTELLKAYIRDYVNFHIEDFEIDVNEIANSTALILLSKIQDIILDDKISDSEAIEKIISLFEEYDIQTGCRHDF